MHFRRYVSIVLQRRNGRPFKNRWTRNRKPAHHFDFLSPNPPHKREDRYPGKEIIAQAAKAAGLTPVQAHAYCRHARNREREGKVLHKFTEVAWKLAVHVFLTGLGAYAVLVQQPWFWDPDSCWKAYPRLPVPRPVYWYYMLEFGCVFVSFV